LQLPYDTVIVLLGNHSREMKVNFDAKRTWIFIAPLVIIAKTEATNKN
jgi:hypothetical protein